MAGDIRALLHDCVAPTRAPAGLVAQILMLERLPYIVGTNLHSRSMVGSCCEVAFVEREYLGATSSVQTSTVD